MLANDDAVAGVPSVATLVRGAAHGTATLAVNGGFVYVPTSGFVGSDSFVYRVHAGGFISNDALVTITVEPANQPPVVNAGPDRSITLPPGTAQLNGSVQDDGLPLGGVLTSTWSRVSGPGLTTFANPSSPVTTATLGATGTYVLRLTASDGELSSFDEMTVVVSPAANQPPLVNAGPDRTVTEDEGVIFEGSFADDGLPIGGTVTQIWGVVSGPTAPLMDDNTQLTLDVLFPEPGLYELILIVNDGELDGFDTVLVEVLPRVNQAPVVSAGPDLTVTLPGAASLLGRVQDDGLPEGSTPTVQWSRVAGTPGVVFANPNSASTTATFPGPGAYTLRLTASDGAFTVSDDVNVVVNPPAPNQAPVVSAGPDLEIQLPTSSVTLGGVVTDDGLPFGVPLVVSWAPVSGPAAPVIASPTTPSTLVSFAVPGSYVFRLTASDSEFTVTDDVTVMVWAEPGGAGPEVDLASPADSATITESTPVVGSVIDDDLFEWYLEHRSIDGGEWTRFATGTTPVTAASLGTFDPTLLENGIYEIRLTATDLSRQFTSTTVTVIVEGNQKVGNFTLSFKDLEVPVAGIPIQVTRTYDSRNKRVGDFGFGWTLDIKSVKVQENRVPGRLWNAEQEVGPLNIPRFCLRPARPHLVTLSFADGKVFKFEVGVALECQNGAPIEETTIVFRPLPGTTASLSLVGGNTVIVNASWPGEAELVASDGSEIFDPNRYVLTLHDGRELRLDQATGLEEVRDTNGNVLEVRPTGLFHSSGKSITFARDGLGRITRITDPLQNHLDYAYDARGDLATFTDPATNISTYSYDARHLLVGIEDPRGIEPIRNEYDNAGRLLKHTDAFGKEINYAHDLVARTEVVTDRLGNATTHAYDDRGNVLSTIDALGNETTFTYDERDNKLTECNALGDCVTFTYDLFDNKLTECNDLDECTTFTYDSRGNVLTTTDDLGRITTNRYDSRGNLEETEDAAGNLTTYEYNDQGLQESMTDAANQTTTFGYDSSGNLTSEVDAANHATTYGYDANGNRRSQTTTRTTLAGLETLVTTFEYDELNRLTRTIHPDGSTSEVEYNSIGQQSATIDQLGRRTERIYDELGRLITVNYEDGTSETTGYDAEGRRTTATDRAGRTTSFEYDEVGRLVRTVFPDESFTTTAYDDAGRTLSTTDETGATTSFGYDVAGRRILTVDPIGAETSFTYDAVGNQITMTDPLDHVTTYEYDDLNRRTAVIYDDTSTDETEYDALGRRTAKIDQGGKRTEFGYDALGRLTSVTDAADGVTQYGYDEAGNQVSQTDALGRVTRFAYDRMGRRIRRTLPAVPPATTGAFESMTYDDAGNQVTKTDFLGRTTTFEYDLNNRLTTKTYPDTSEVGFAYTASGRRLTATDARGITSYEYDDRDRITALTYPDGRKLEYGYDLRGARTSLRAEVGGTELETTYGYDDAGRLDSVTDPNNGTYSFDYDNAGRRTRLDQPNGTRTTYTYDTLNRLTNLTTVHVPSSTSIQSYAYTLGATGIRTRIDEAGGVARTYGYDNLYRLTSETVTGSATNYAKVFTYDAVGNRETQATTGFGTATVAYTYDTRDRLLMENTTASTWDANGNLTSRAGDGEYTWDFDDRLVRVTKSDGTVVEHTYDVDGVRVRTRTVPAGGTEEIAAYLVDTAGALSHVVAETNGAGTLTAYYVRGGDQLLAVLRGADARYYHADGLGSVRALTDAGGTATDGYGYTAFGEALGWTGANEQPYRFAGEEWEDRTDATYLRRRWLVPDHGRFISMDPLMPEIGAPLTGNPFTYSNCSPVSASDPTGKFTLAETSITTAILGELRGLSFSKYYKDDIKFLFSATEITFCMIEPGYQAQAAALNATANGFHDRFVSDLYAVGVDLVNRGTQELAAARGGGHPQWTGFISGKLSALGYLSLDVTAKHTELQNIYSPVPDRIGKIKTVLKLTEFVTGLGEVLTMARDAKGRSLSHCERVKLAKKAASLALDATGFLE